MESQENRGGGWFLLGQQCCIARMDAAKSSHAVALSRDPPETLPFLLVLSCRQLTESNLTLSSIL